MYPLTLLSSTANVFIACCILSNEVDFQTKSAEKPCVQSVGTPSDRRSSRPISSLTSARVKKYGSSGLLFEDSPCERVRRTVGDLNNVSNPVPVAALEPAAVQLKSELVPNRQSHLSALELGHAKPRDALLVETNVPPDDDVVLRLRLLDLLVVVGLNLDERSKDVLVLVRVLVPGTAEKGR